MFFIMMWLHIGSNSEKMHQMSRWYVDKTMVVCRRWYPGDLEQNWHKQSLGGEKTKIAHCVETTAGLSALPNSNVRVCSEYFLKWALRYLGCARPDEHTVTFEKNEPG